MPPKQKKTKTPKTPLETAVLLLTRQPMSRLALKKKLHDKGFSWKDSEDTVAECERYGSINDKLVAEAKVAMMRDRGDGSRKIKLTLRLKGFEKETIDEAFRTDDKNSERDELAVAMEFLRRRKTTFDREADPVKRKTRALRALASKGFGSGVSYEALSRFFGGNELDFPDEVQA